MSSDITLPLFQSIFRTPWKGVFYQDPQSYETNWVYMLLVYDRRHKPMKRKTLRGIDWRWLRYVGQIPLDQIRSDWICDSLHYRKTGDICFVSPRALNPSPHWLKITTYGK